MMQISAIIFFNRCFIPYVECSSVKLCLILKPLVHLAVAKFMVVAVNNKSMSNGTSAGI